MKKSLLIVVFILLSIPIQAQLLKTGNTIFASVNDVNQGSLTFQRESGVLSYNINMNITIGYGGRRFMYLFDIERPRFVMTVWNETTGQIWYKYNGEFYKGQQRVYEPFIMTKWIRFGDVIRIDWYVKYRWLGDVWIDGSITVRRIK